MTNSSYAAPIRLSAADGESYERAGFERISPLNRLYVWSVVVEPLLFFVLFERTVTGVTGNLSRLLQFAVLIGLFLRLTLGSASRTGRVRVIELGSPLYRYYSIYFLLAIGAGILGIATGAYRLPIAYESQTASAISTFLNSETVRPVFEYVIAAYYFVYFTVLPQYFLQSRRALEYFFSVFRKTFILCLIVGGLDLAAALAGIHLVPRQLSSPLYVGPRFHGLAGEPRDAFVYLFLGLAMLHLRAYFHGEGLGKWWIAIIVAAALLTQSASGLIGVMVFLVLYGIYSLEALSSRRVVQLVILSALVVGVVYETTIHTARLMEYVHGGADLWYILESGTVIPTIMQVQIINVFPLYDLTLKARAFQWIPILVGSGLGSASALNNQYTIAGLGLNNPNSQLVRTLYESGIIGGIVFLKAFTHPVMYLTRSVPVSKRHEFLLLTLLLLGCFFGQRSAAPFIYVGALIAVFRHLEQKVSVRASIRAARTSIG